MSLPLPLRLDEDTLPILLVRGSQRLVGDGQLHMMAGMPLRPSDVVSIATVNTNHIALGFSSGDATLITNELTKRKATKA